MSIVFHENTQTFQDTLPYISLSRQSTFTVDSPLAPHWHERMEIWYVHQGTMTVSCDQDIFDITAGDVLVINPGQVHSCRVTQVPSMIDCMIFDLNGLSPNHPGEVDTLLRSVRTGAMRFRHIIHNSSLMQQIISQIMESRPTESWSLLRVQGLLYQLLSVLAEKYVSTDNYAVAHHLQEVGYLLEYIHSHYSEELYLELLAEKACMSPAYFCRWFKEAVGESPMSYVTTLRINRAYELLLDGCSVTQACHRVGMTDVNNFTRHFRKRVGLSPSKIKSGAKERSSFFGK